MIYRPLHGPYKTLGDIPEKNITHNSIYTGSNPSANAFIPNINTWYVFTDANIGVRKDPNKKKVDIYSSYIRHVCIRF